MRAFHLLKLAMSLAMLASAVTAHAGFDIAGKVQRVQIAADGKLWFAVDNTQTTTFCKPGWFDMTMYVPPSDPQYAYYFAMLMAAATKGKTVYIANISVFNGSTSCDITQTGFGLTFIQ